MLAELAGEFIVWAASKEARFLKGKFAWVNWDVEELKAAANDIDAACARAGAGDEEEVRYSQIEG